MGGSDRGREGMWRWETSGSRMNYTDWEHGEPDNGGSGEDCLSIINMWYSGGRWFDESCHRRHRYICESV